MRILLALTCLQASAAITVRSAQATSTQAVISYVTASASACTVEVSEESDYSPLVADVDPAKFTGSDQDSRTGSITSGTDRQFVVGANFADVAADGKRYTRALRADTLHYYRISVCGGDTATGTFKTAPPPLGKTYAEPLPVDPDVPGAYAYPSQDWSSDTAEVIDPQTGATLRRVTRPQDVTANTADSSFTSAAVTTGWTSPNNVLADDGSSATFSGAGSNKLLVKVSLALTDGGNGPVSVDYLRVKLKASGAAASGADRTVGMCWTIDGSTCASGTLTQALTGSLALYTIGTTAPMLTAWGAVPFAGRDQIASNSNFGLLIWKTTSSTDNIVVQWVGYDLGASYQASWTPGGFFELCNANPVTISSEVGYYCYLLDSMGVHNMYWVGSAGSRRLLGRMWVPNDGSAPAEVTTLTACQLQPDTASANIAWCIVNNSSAKPVLIKVTYDGSNTDVAPLTWAQTGGHLTFTNVTPSTGSHDLNALATAYDSGFAAPFSCSGVRAVQSGKLLIWCLADGQQDRMGWAMAFDPGNGGVIGSGGTGSVIALTDFHTGTNARWCQPHSLDPLGNVAYMQMTTNTFSSGSSNGQGPYTASLNGGIDDTVTQLTLNSEPCDPTPGGGETNTNNANCSNSSYHYLQSTAVGDFIKIDNEFMKITGKTGLVLDVERNSSGSGGYPLSAASHSNGATVEMQCSQRGLAVWWDYVNDPHGAAKRGNPRDSGSHRISRNGTISYVGDGWQTAPFSYNSQEFYANQTGGFPAALDATPTRVAMQPAFAGKTAPQGGNLWQTHGSMPADASFLMDARPLIGGTDSKLTGTFTAVSGDLYKYASGAFLNRKHLPTFVEGGNRQLVDISSATTGDQIADDSSAAYTYCYAEKVNECRTGSSAGDLYVNIPNLTQLYCYNNGIDVRFGGVIVRDVCASNMPPYAHQIAQMSSTHDVFGRYGRSITSGLSPYKGYIYWNTRLLPDASWTMFLATEVDGGARDEVLMAKMPPQRLDSINRGTFVPVPISAGSAPAGADRMLVKYGYNSSFYCTSRAEVCYAAASIVNESTPFIWAGDLASGDGDSTPYAVAVPAIPDRVIYMQVIWRTGTTTVASDPVQVLAVR